LIINARKRGETLALINAAPTKVAFDLALAPRYPFRGGSGGDGRNDKIGIAEVPRSLVAKPRPLDVPTSRARIVPMPRKGGFHS